MSILRNSLAVCAIAFGLSGPVSAQSASDVVATVDGTEITLGHMIALRERLPDQYQQLEDDVLFDAILQQLIDQTALSLQNTSATQRTEILLENERRTLLASEMVQQTADGAVTDEALQAVYDANYGEAEPTPEFNASHILVETEEEAQTLLEDLDGGADFAELAMEKSTGPSGPSGGELGWFGPGQMVPTFDEAVQAMNAGDVAGPVQTDFGWHVIKLNDTRQKDAPSLDDVRAQLVEQVQQEAVAKLVADTTAAAEIVKDAADGIDASLIRNDALLDQ